MQAANGGFVYYPFAAFSYVKRKSIHQNKNCKTGVNYYI